MAEPVSHLVVIGPGRAGLALGSLLLEVGAARRLTCLGRSPAPPDHPLFRESLSAARYRTWANGPVDDADAVIIAVPDGSIREIAAALAEWSLPTRVPVLHLSGALSSEELEPLARKGFPTGSLHPLVALADVRAGESLRGAWFAVEGAPAAVALAEGLVESMDGQLLRVSGPGKALYHAGAVAASNFVVALLAVAERWVEEAGVPPEAALPALTSLAAGAVESVRRRGPVDALTGPVSRGDSETVRRHLGRLSASDRSLYSVLASATLELARRRGLDSQAADDLARLLEPTE